MIKRLWKRLRQQDKLDSAIEEARINKEAFDMSATPEVMEMSIKNGKFDATFKSATISMFIAEEFYRVMRDHGAENVLECSVNRKPIGDDEGGDIGITVTYQKRTGKTPMELVTEARIERDIAFAKLEAARDDRDRFMRDNIGLERRLELLLEIKALCEKNLEGATTDASFGALAEKIEEYNELP